MSKWRNAALPFLAVLMCACSDSNGTQANRIPATRVDQAVAQLDSVVNDVMTRSGIPGMAIAVVYADQVVYAKGFGVRRVGEPARIEPETVFQLASISKPLGATVVATQVAESVVSWDTPVIRHLPWFSMPDPDTTQTVTIGDLYAHRSGLPDHAGDDLEEVGHGRQSVLERLHLLPAAPLRSAYAYTNFGLTAAAESVAQASKLPWEALSEQMLYRPLGMNATSSRHADFMSRPNRASPHVRDGDQFVPGAQREPDAQSPAGGASSNVLDMAKWMQLILNEGRYEGRQIVAREALKPALEPQMLSSPANGDRPAGYYGYGFNINTSEAGHTRYSHSGAFSMGAATSVAILPAARTGIIVLTNAQPIGAAETVTAAYMDLVESGTISRDWYEAFTPVFDQLNAPVGRFAGQPFPVQPAPPRPAHAYTGAYSNAYFGDATVEAAGDNLTLKIGPAQQTFALQHWDGDTFIFEISGEVSPPGSRSAVTFTPGPGGTATEMNIEIYDEWGQGTLKRR